MEHSYMKQFLILIVSLIIPLIAQAATPITICPLIDKAPDIDGEMNDACWEKASIIKRFVHCSTGKKAKAKSICRLVTDGKKLYIFASLYDKNAPSFSRKKDPRDKINWSETFELFIAPEIDKGRYYHIVVNPAGSLYDNIGLSTASDYDFDISYATKINTDSWQVEMAVTLKDIGIISKLKSGDKMGLNVCRYSKQGVSTWSLTGDSFHNRDNFGTLIIGSYSSAAKKNIAEIESIKKQLPKVSNKTNLKFQKLKRLAQKIDSAKQFRYFSNQANDLKHSIKASMYPAGKLFFWQCTPWALPKSSNLPSPKKLKKSFKLTGFRNEFLTFALGLGNPDSKAIAMRCEPSRVFNLDTGEVLLARDIIKIHRAVELKIRGNAIQRDALPVLNLETIFDVRPQTNEIIWLTVDTRKISAGRWGFTLNFLPLIRRSFSSKVNFEIAVAPVALPTTAEPYSYNWARYNWPPTKDILHACYQDQKDHYTNVQQTDPLGEEVGLKSLKFDKEGKLLNDPDLSALQKKVDFFGPKCMYLFGVRYSNLPPQFLPGKKWSAEQAKANFTKYVKAVYAFFDKNKIPSKLIVWNLEDEPDVKRAQEAVKLSKMLLEIIPDRYECFVDFYRKTPLEAIRLLLPYVTVWCPSYSPDDAQMKLIKKHGKKNARMFAYAVNTRAHNPYWAYRMQGINSFTRGYVGMAFWNYCDAGDTPNSSTWDDFSNARRTVSHFAVIYNGTYEPVTSVRWEAWRQGIIDYKLLAWLKKLTADLASSSMKKEAAELLKNAVKKSLGSSDKNTVDIMMDKVRRLIIKILIKEGKLPTSATNSFASSGIVNLTGNDYILKNKRVKGHYLVGCNPHKFMFGPANKMTDKNLRYPEGCTPFSSRNVIFDLGKPFKLQWFIFQANSKALKNNGKTARCYISNNKKNWKEVKLASINDAIRGVQVKYKIDGKKYRYIKISMLGEKTKIIAEAKILGKVK